MLIGLTGLYCAGKNHVAALLEKRGLAVLDVDRLGHAAIENQKAAIVARFGEAILGSDGSVNRKLLGERVFRRQEDISALEELVHPEANRLTLGWIAAQGGQNCVINAALLHKSAVFQRLGCIILVKAPLFARLARARSRDRLPWAAIARRLWSQRRFFAQYSAGNADIYRVENPGFGEDRLAARLEGRIDAILSELGLNN
ncbi:MAG: dephospho-CoA kinase [Treponema sp.]|jgi:dephospho-CoA kinase|nr:dephospho-CoA kinase [Treponema sp.]